MRVRPCGDQVRLKQIEEEEQTKGGIIIPEAAEEKRQGDVTPVGGGKTQDNARSCHWG